MTVASACGATRKSPANRLVVARESPEAGVVAMQKVVGSNPISRFTERPQTCKEILTIGADRTALVAALTIAAMLAFAASGASGNVCRVDDGA